MDEMFWGRLVSLFNEIGVLAGQDALSQTEDDLIFDKNGVGFPVWLQTMTKKVLTEYEKKQEQSGPQAACWIEDRIVRVSLDEDTVLLSVFNSRFEPVFEHTGVRTAWKDARQHLEDAIEALACEYYGPVAQGKITRTSIPVAYRVEYLDRHLREKRPADVETDADSEDPERRKRLAASTRNPATINYLAEEEMDDSVLAALAGNRNLTVRAQNVIADSCFSEPVIRALCANPAVSTEILTSYLGSDLAGIDALVRKTLCQHLQVVTVLSVTLPKQTAQPVLS